MSEEQRRGRRAIETGPTGQAVGQNLAVLRKRRDLTTRQLSKLLADAGRPIPASGITRMEQGDRQTTVDDLVALAFVLEVPLVDLIMPPVDPNEPAAPVFLTPTVRVDDRQDLIWWLVGHRSLPGRDEETYRQSPRAREITSRRGMRTTMFVQFLEQLSDVVGPTASRLFEELAVIIGQLEDGELSDALDLEDDELRDGIESARIRLERKAAAFDEGRGQ